MPPRINENTALPVGRHDGPRTPTSPALPLTYGANVHVCTRERSVHELRDTGEQQNSKGRSCIDKYVQHP